ncbi:MAG: hypothetical protein ACO1RA_07695 [Planctomycetaceae bacterium]
MSDQPTLLNRILEEAEQAKAPAACLESALQAEASTSIIDLLSAIRMDAHEASKKYLSNTIVPFGGE